MWQAQRARLHQQRSMLQGAGLTLVCTCRPTWQQQYVVQEAYHRQKVWNQVNRAAINSTAC